MVAGDLQEEEERNFILPNKQRNNNYTDST